MGSLLMESWEKYMSLCLYVVRTMRLSAGKSGGRYITLLVRVKVIRFSGKSCLCYPF